MFWVESYGGPLVLIEKNLLHEWGGIDTSSDPDYSSDYDRACTVDDYAGKLSIPGGEVIIFGDEPSRTSFVRFSDRKFMIVRWRWAPDADTVNRYLQELDKLHFKYNGRIQTRFNDNNVLIFDSSIRDPGSTELLSIDLLPGSYVLETTMFEPDRETCLLLHKLQRF